MDKTKEEFVVFIRHAMADQSSDSFTELYDFLVNCFTRADVSMLGKVNLQQFDTMIEEAAEMPRKYGFAPRTDEMYSSLAARKEARAKMFKEMNLAKDGSITLEEWIAFAVKHIIGKLATLPSDKAGGSNVAKGEFMDFIVKAVDKKSVEYRELYYFLLKCFMDADQDRDGAILPQEFDRMIEVAAAAPRRFGLAPSSKDMYKSDAQRLAKRSQEFSAMNTKNDGKISFDEWLNYAMDHIVGKVAKMAK